MNVARATAVPAASPRRALDVAAIRRDFPVLAREVHGRPLCYLDNAASSQHPRPVIDAVARRDDVEGAFQHLASNNTFGKVLLLW